MVMTKIFCMMTAVLLGTFITSCSSEDDGVNNGEELGFLDEIASRHSDGIDVSLLTGGWTEAGYVITVDGKVQERGQNEEYARYRFNVTDGKQLTLYLTYEWVPKKRSIKLIRPYHYSPDTRQFFIEDNMHDNLTYVIDYLGDDYMTLTSGTHKRILQRVDDKAVAAWESSYRPEVRGSVSDYGVYLGEDKDWHLAGSTAPFSTSRFQEVIVGHPLQCVEMHKILDDGSIWEFDYDYLVDGNSTAEFLFGGTTLKVIASNTAMPELGPWVKHEYDYTYEEAANKVSSPTRMTLLSYDEEKDQVLMILRPGNIFAIYQRASMEWWGEMEALCGKE